MKKIQSPIRPKLSGGGSWAIGLGVAAGGGHGVNAASRPIPAADSNRGGVLDGDLGTVERIQGRAEGVQGRSAGHRGQGTAEYCVFLQKQVWHLGSDCTRKMTIGSSN
jgi:hypothetical protein